jgi:hypothetical protein
VPAVTKSNFLEQSPHWFCPVQVRHFETLHKEQRPIGFT